MANQSLRCSRSPRSWVGIALGRGSKPSTQRPNRHHLGVKKQERGLPQTEFLFNCLGTQTP